MTLNQTKKYSFKIEINALKLSRKHELLLFELFVSIYKINNYNYQLYM